LEDGHRNGQQTIVDCDELDRFLSLRESIDNLDSALVHLLAERFKLTQEIGLLKARNGLPPTDPDREIRQTARLRALAIDANLDPEFTEKWFKLVVSEVVSHHEIIAAREE